MNVFLTNPNGSIPTTQLQLSGSKSETNRMLLLQALYPQIKIVNASNSDDSQVMLKALKNFQLTTLNAQLVDVHHAGTAMRFLTAFFAIKEGTEVVLTGSTRMKERPVKILVEALRQLGAEISYLEKEGYPPLRIKGTKLTKQKVNLAANISSQYISALLLIAPKLENGLELVLEGEITSMPYIKMTLALLNEIGVKTLVENNTIKVIQHQLPIIHHPITVESDWSSASYWYSFIALAPIGTQITLASFKKNSLQGDSVLVEIYKNFGVETIFNDKKITLHKVANLEPATLNLELNNCPDIAQTIAVTCFGLGIVCELSGLHTLKIKETDRLLALQTELTKLGAVVSCTDDSIRINKSQMIKENVVISTYNDHRMALSFAPLALKVPIVIENADVVSKSYPGFWEDVKRFGIGVL
ncbi:3-phosphoshikimate 1-carboxyvinyltransferase [Flavobacterium sp. 20NA77.7]|uniref:3-phosphoshikimate 1-carboxyvinyltransferase n=1 Tax=Flavobacterium nakdongensis TaxID=3073563 RepID=A0ABY9RBA8_9FLAO|nr:3-phosphoshikimate 1-carboxyvinyltransferase [Flavobacterium sp. 20NA77.7]WMW77502.1 3-phosphoshikimate 1-carboxyvinyltransferase [Flavobacterium sp. 20NA77.7]